ncbi:LPP20 family lipoprotein [Halocola ammonii]
MIRILKISTLLIFVLLLAACSGNRELADSNPEQTEPQRPYWIKERPTTGGYYIGIGSASKTRNPLDYAQVAKKNALNDLASEIKVTVEGESFLNVIEHDYDFQESFQSTVVTKTSEEIQDYEAVDNWENEGEYWVFYRLSKAEHERLKRERKNNAMRSASDFFDKSIEAAEKKNIGQSIKLHLQALDELKPYWGESNEIERNGDTVFLDNEIYSHLLNMLSDLKLETSSNEVKLEHSNGFSSEITVTAFYKDEPVSGIPIHWYYNKRKYSRPKTLITGNDGKGKIVVDEVELSDSNNALDLKIDSETLIAGQHASDLSEAIAKGTQLDSKKLPIEVIFPAVQLNTSEKQYDSPGSEKLLANALQNSLSKEGLRFTNERSAADYIFEVDANTTKGGESQGFHVAYLNMTVTVKKASTGEEVYRKGMNQIKGLQLNFDAASTEAYKKGAKIIEEEIAGDIVSTLL